MWSMLSYCNQCFKNDEMTIVQDEDFLVLLSVSFSMFFSIFSLRFLLFFFS